MTSALSSDNSPVRLTGELDPKLSRWLWLGKMFLAIPHYLVLAFLLIAFLITTVIAGFAILFTVATRARCSTSSISLTAHGKADFTGCYGRWRWRGLWR